MGVRLWMCVSEHRSAIGVIEERFHRGVFLESKESMGRVTDDRVDRLLSRIMLQEEREPSTAAAINSYIWTDDRRARALVFARRLHWPRMTRPGTQAVLREIGRLLNQYRKAWSGPPGVANPIFEVVLPPLS